MESTQYNILLPVNFSSSTEKLIESVFSFKSEINYKIYALVVVQNSNEQSEALNKLNSLLKEKELDATCMVRCGEVAKETLLCANEIDASMILINKVGIEVKNQNIGELTKEIVKKSEIPVLVLKDDLRFSDVSSILLPLDINKENKKKLRNAIFFAKFFHNSCIRIVSVVFDTNDYNMNRNVFQLQHIVNFIEKHGFECSGEIIRCSSEYGDSLGKIVCDYAEKSEAELVLLMSDHEENKNKLELNEDSEYMLSMLTNNIITIIP